MRAPSFAISSGLLALCFACAPARRPVDRTFTAAKLLGCSSYTPPPQTAGTTRTVSVVARFTVDSIGDVVPSTVTVEVSGMYQASTREAAAQQAERDAKSCRYQPARRGGLAVSSSSSMVFRYERQ